MALVELWPLSMAERVGVVPTFLAGVFDDPARLLADSERTRQRYLDCDCMVAGGYPEVLGIGSAVARGAWYGGYLSTVINRDIRDFATVTRGDALSRLLRVIAARAGSVSVLTDLAQSVELSRDITSTAVATASSTTRTHLLCFSASAARASTTGPGATSGGVRLIGLPTLYGRV